MSYSTFGHDPTYVSQQPGWRLAFVSLVVAAILGLAFRVYFSPQRIKGWIEAELKRQPAKIDLQFKSAELRLARGALPQLAIRLTDVEGRAARSCAKTPGFRVSEIHIPFRLIPLFRGQVLVGTVHGGALSVDLDALRDNCERIEGAASVAQESASKQESKQDQKVGAAGPDALAVGGTVRPWWTPEQVRTVRNLVSGLRFDSVELKFERGRKHVVFEDLSARADLANDAIFVSTDVRVPPALLFDHQFPPFALEATIKPDAADVEIKGSLAEGNLNGLATLKAMRGDVWIDAHLHATSVPLSALLPFARRAGWLDRDIRAKFLWLQCEASIRGRARGLFRENPLQVEKCAVEGESGRVAVERATFGPGEKLEPFEIALAGVDIEKWLAMLGRKGPSGVMSKFGRLSGRVHVRSRDHLVFDGAWLDSQLLFSRRNVRVQQPVSEIRGRIERRLRWPEGGRGKDKQGRPEEHWTATFNEIRLAGGKFDGQVAIEANGPLQAGSVDVDIRELRLHPDVEKLLLGGEWSGFRLQGRGALAEGRLGGFSGNLEISGIKGAEIRADKMSSRILLNTEGQVKLDANIAEGEIRGGSRVVAVVAPVLLGHKFEEEWVAFKSAIAQITIFNRDLRWEKASVLLRNGQIWLTSAGLIQGQGDISGWVGVDFPKMKKLRWDLSGKGNSPRLEPNDRTRRDTAGREFSDAALGVFVPASKSKSVETTASQGVGLRSLGEKVLERAKAILPTRESKVEKGVAP